MLAASGLLILLAMGYAVSGMVADDGRGAPDDGPPAPAPEGDDDTGGTAVTDGSDTGDPGFGDEGRDPPGADPSDAAQAPVSHRIEPGDHVVGTDGADVFEMSAAANNTPEEVARIERFQAGIDRLVLEFDGTAQDTPEIGFDTETTPGSTLVLANGLPAALLVEADGIGPDDVEVVMTAGEAIDGTEGDDTLTGGEGDDTLDGYAGDDLLDGGTGDDLLRGREGMDSLLGGNGNDAVTGGPGTDTIEGGPDNDMLVGNEGDDLIRGGSGADEVYGEDGDDVIEGGAGTDFLVGGDGQDSLSGGDQSDLLFGNDGDDLLSGDAGDDYLQGGFGADTLLGGAGNDRLDGTFAAGDSIFGPFDEDQRDVLDGGDGDDTIVIGAGDVATGGDGADTFVSGSFIELAELAGHVSDFDPSRDVIEVMFDPELTPDPQITVEDFEDGTGAYILFEGRMILSVSGAQGLDPARIELRDITLDRVAETA